MRRPHLTHLALALVALAAGSAGAQVQTYTKEAFSDLPPTARGAQAPPPPKMAFRLEAEIPLPGPLPTSSPRLTGQVVEVDVAGGTLRTALDPGSIPEWVDGSAVDEREAPDWVEDARGRFRYRATDEGTVEAQRKCRRCKPGWKRCWRLRVPGNTVALPLVHERRVFFGALDNRVYCVKARTGHRVWTADLPGRVSTSLVRWAGEVANPRPAEGDPPTRALNAVLAIPNGGAEIVALELERGGRIGGIKLADAEGKLVGGPVVTPDGRIVVARQKYAESEASLMVYRLVEIAAVEPDAAGPTASVEPDGPAAP